ncbi:SDR family oxidoreductase [Arthrobacter sp. NPDC093139]|uniref:SDR family oxidoreductase n=1 Tax=Arthrobacter sp. NPDC093139 TaxID=3363945 RepID=UPI0038100A8E
MTGYKSAFRPGLFEDQTIIVTGGGSGIGRCVAHELSSLGAHVVLVGRKQEKLDSVLAEIEEDGGSASAYSGDIREEARVIEIIEAVLSENGQINGLVNNAGGQYRAALNTIKTKGFEAVMRSNVVGGFIMMREVYNRYMEKDGGAIVNVIADMWNGWPMYGHSGAARAAMWNLTETAAAEWGHAGVRVNAVAPRTIASSGLDTYDAQDNAWFQRDLRKEVPLQRWGNESEASAAITYLLSPASAFTSGSVIRVDGAAPNGARAWVEPEVARNNKPFEAFHRAVTPKILGGV